MCGIFALLNNDDSFDKKFIETQFKKGEKRGPEFSSLEKYENNVILGFHRLAINGLNNESNQPIIINNVMIVCNGEIYNYKELYKIMNVIPTTDSDCEIIIHLYIKYGMKQTLQMLDGVFAFVLYDQRNYNENAKIYIVRDPYGVRPLYILKSNSKTNPDYIYGIASELKVLTCFNNKLHNCTINHVNPGSYSKLIMNSSIKVTKWNLVVENKKYFSHGFNRILDETILSFDYKLSVYKNIQSYLYSAVKKRTIVTERPVACLLSGGLDSSLITALVNEINKDLGLGPIETYSIGLAGSEDLKYARIVADYLGTNHNEIVVSESDFINAIPEVIYAIESYDTTTVRASIGNYLLGKYIAAHSEAKVIFNGDGSDELCGGYLYMHACPDEIEFDKETRRLLKNIYAFDVLRSDKSISSHGLEPRTPFLDRSWVQYYLSIPGILRFHPGNKECEKFLLRTAFSEEYYKNSNGHALLPDCILWRTKEAFSDGVSNLTKSLYQIIQEGIPEFVYNENSINSSHNKPDTPEKKYYRMLFNEYYKKMDHIVPYFWMPKYVNSVDASARTLTIYNKIKEQNKEK